MFAHRLNHSVPSAGSKACALGWSPVCKRPDGPTRGKTDGLGFYLLSLGFFPVDVVTETSAIHTGLLNGSGGVFGSQQLASMVTSSGQITLCPFTR
jgi:hypothetical protein